METIDELIENFKKNIEMGHQTTMLFNGDDSVTLSCDPKTDGYVGFTVVNKHEHKFPHREKALDQSMKRYISKIRGKYSFFRKT
jgi:hypothetical protein